MNKKTEKQFLKYAFCVLFLMTAIAGFSFSISGWGWFLACSLIVYYHDI